MLDWASRNGVGFSSVISLGGSTRRRLRRVDRLPRAGPKTEHILLYIEGVRDGPRLVGSLRAAARAKPVILMKVGRHPAGSRAAVSHTGAIVGSDDVFDAVVRRTASCAWQHDGARGAAQALAATCARAASGLAVITNGGGPGVMAADRAATSACRSRARDRTVARLQSALPATWSHGNPIDLIGDAGPERYRAAVARVPRGPGVDGVVAILTPQAMTDADAAAAR
jgi:acetyltransferase